jgi:CBS domain-containing protein
MSEKNIGCLPIVSNKRLLGMLTEREIVNIVHLTQKFQHSRNGSGLAAD